MQTLGDVVSRLANSKAKRTVGRKRRAVLTMQEGVQDAAETADGCGWQEGEKGLGDERL